MMMCNVEEIDSTDEPQRLFAQLWFTFGSKNILIRIYGE